MKMLGLEIKVKRTSTGFYFVRTCRGFQYFKNRSSFHQSLFQSSAGPIHSKMSVDHRDCDLLERKHSQIL